MAYKPTDTTVINGSTNSPDGNAVYDYVGTGGPFLPLAGGTLTGDVSGTGLTLSVLTASQIVATDANKKLQTLAIATYPSLTELSYVKSVTSSIQTQLNSKAPIASPTFTGIVVAPAFYTSSNGVFLESGGDDNYAGLWGQEAPDTTYRTNYAILFNKAGTFASLNGTGYASLCVGNVIKLIASPTALGASVPLLAQDAYLGNYSAIPSWAQFKHQDCTEYTGILQNAAGDIDITVKSFYVNSNDTLILMSPRNSFRDASSAEVMSVTSTAVTATVPVVAPSLTITEDLVTSVLTTATATLAPLAGKTYEITNSHLYTCTLTLTITDAMTVGNECYMSFGGYAIGFDLILNYPNPYGSTQTIITTCGSKRNIIIRRASSGFLVVG